MDIQLKAKKLAEKIFEGGDNFYAIQQGKYWKIGFTNDYPLQHGNGSSYLIPNDIIIYLISIENKFEEAIQSKIKDVKNNGDMGIKDSAYWNTCGLHDSIEILKKVI